MAKRFYKILDDRDITDVPKYGTLMIISRHNVFFREENRYNLKQN